MLRFITRRLLTAIPVLILISIGAFFMLQLAPGDASRLYLTPEATQEQIEATRRALGLDQPIYIQYWRWLMQVLRGDLGRSFTNFAPVMGIIRGRLSPTLLLMGVSLVVSYTIAIPLGILCARKQGSWVDSLITGFTFAGVSIPNFFLGLGMVYIFGVRLDWFPTGGMYQLGTVPTVGTIAHHLVMPVTILATFLTANMTRYVRSTMIEVYSENYMRTATAKGLSRRKILTKHGIRNALIPVITVIGTDLPRLVGGAIVTEEILTWPGLGSLTIIAIGQRNYPILMAITMLSAVVVLLSNLLVDVLYAVLDPRIKYD